MKGESHFRVAVYKPSKVRPGWKPRHVEDSIRALDREQIRYTPGRYRELLPALCEARRLNMEAMICDLDRWSVVAHIDNGKPSVTTHFVRNVTPLRYTVHEVITSPEWRPDNLLAAPHWSWTDEKSTMIGPSRLRTLKNLDAAALYVARKNKRFRQRKRENKYGIGARWHIALALECEPMIEAVYLDGNTKGIASRHEHSRFHLVDLSWPLSAATLAEIGGRA
jgi:hypothetical protein